MEARILVVDDELSMREFLSILLECEGYHAVVAASAAEALTELDRGDFDLVISDVQMPGLNGIDLLSRVKAQSPETAVLMMTAFSAAEQAVEAMRLGAYDYIGKPFKNDEIKLLVRNALEKSSLKRENRMLRQVVEQRDSFCGIVGNSPQMKEIFSLIQKVAPSPTSVLIQGESGTGKELVARAIHSNSPRAAKPFVAVNCGAIPETLIESELFGHKKGAFTGAVADRAGLFEQADGGTLFLDEIGELPSAMQTKLLRVLQEKEFRRVGGTQVQKCDARILTASNRDLQGQVRDGAFREDLYYRINVVQICIPPLRERVEDIPALIECCCRKYAQPGRLPAVAPDAMKILLNYTYPGNIRELENIVERSLIMNPDCIESANLPSLSGQAPMGLQAGSIHIPSEGIRLENMLEELEKGYLFKALEMTGGAKKKAADLLGMSFRSFRYRLAKFGVDDGEE
ncbi:MAG TPA: sigma-54 dependent transcriptional regulator [Deltaproteobacteria bacterium]|nr:sigma-54 dependent transcriptional regulator [Deltaproteobacteria bacterium]